LEVDVIQPTESPALAQPCCCSDAAEQWLPVRGYEGLYEVSSRGQVRRIGTGCGSVPGRILRLTKHPQGYQAVSLSSGNHRQTFLVHRLVAAAFLGPVPAGHEVNHKDGDKRHNCPGNLEYVVRERNIQHAMETGLMNLHGADNPAARLTAEQVVAIRAQHDAGGSGYKRLASEYGVSWGAIRQIVKRRSWGHID
jgi:hypothetical protein